MILGVVNFDRLPGVGDHLVQVTEEVVRRCECDMRFEHRVLASAVRSRFEQRE